MQVRFWGTRGSVATPGPDTLRFGGNTSCVQVTTDSGALFILDCGTGARQLGASLAGRNLPVAATILLSHTHWDHIQGFPFFAPLFTPGNRFTVCGPEGSGKSLREVLAGQMEFTYFPVEIDQLPATIAFRELGEGVHELEGVRVTTHYLHHPAMTLGYRIEADGAALVYLCDHEPFSASLWEGIDSSGDEDSIVHDGDRQHARFMSGADLVIHDAQYTPEELTAKKNWGHSSYGYAVDVAAAAGVHELVLTHHDPGHDDAAVAAIEGRAQAHASALAPDMVVRCAFEGLEIPVVPHGARKPAAARQRSPDHGTAALGAQILIVDDDLDILALARRALTQDGHTVRVAGGGEEALAILSGWTPDLLVLDLLMPGKSGLEVLQALRARPATATLPVVVLTALDGEAHTRAGFELGATDYLTKPFSLPQLAARVRACLARSASVPASL